MAIEEPAFKRVLQDGALEVRDYSPTVVAEVSVNGDRAEAANLGFRILAGYIFGGNGGRQSIAMTAPVAQAPVAPQKIAMTAPVTQTGGAKGWVVRSTMPRQYHLKDLPKPNDARVRLLEEPGRRYAVIRFSGLTQEGDVRRETDRLLRAIKDHGFKAIGPVSLARYDPPWTPWFMRRNEVMAPIESVAP